MYPLGSFDFVDGTTCTIWLVLTVLHNSVPNSLRGEKLPVYVSCPGAITGSHLCFEQWKGLFLVVGDKNLGLPLT